MGILILNKKFIFNCKNVFYINGYRLVKHECMFKGGQDDNKGNDYR